MIPGWAWRCATCGDVTLDPHTGPDDEDLCPDCCIPCITGETEAAHEQFVKDNLSFLTPGEPMLFHGIPSREQMAAAEAGRP